MKNVILLGAGGHARSLIDLAQNCGYTIDSIVDINNNAAIDENIDGIPVINPDSNKSQKGHILSIGDNTVRERYFFEAKNIVQDNLIHSKAYVASMSVLGSANQIFANVFINNKVTLGDNNIINTGAIIEHECTIGNHTHISVGVVIAGRVKVGNRCFIGANSTLIDSITIGDDVIIGAGSVVIKSIPESGTYVGNPARKIK